jgi:tetratricopeptide (TPR) repeat protein
VGKIKRQKIQSDFIGALQNVLDDSNDLVRFDFVVIPKWHAEKIVDSDMAAKYARKCRAHFLVFGSAKVRSLNGQEFHVLRLRQLVVHSPISTDMSKQFSKEMSDVFSGNINVSRENDLLGLEVTSVWLAEAAKYFIAVAAFVSGDLHLSQAFLENLRNSKHLAGGVKNIPGVAKLRQLVPLRLYDVYRSKARYAHAIWRTTREPNNLEEMNENIEKYNKIIPESYEYLLMKAIWYFVIQRDVTNALSLLNTCRGFSDATWRYSVAFLEAYRGNMDDAIRLYEKAFTRPTNQSVPFEVEEFISWVLEIEQDKYQLYFLLGLLNMKAKGDLQRALGDFKTFLERSQGKQFTKAVGLGRKYVAQLEHDLDLIEDEPPEMVAEV